MTAPATVYRIISRVHVSQWDDQLQEAVPGWSLKVLWIKTGTVLPIFVPDTQYTPENIDRLTRAAGATDDAVHALGS